MSRSHGRTPDVRSADDGVDVVCGTWATGFGRNPSVPGTTAD
ncbi:hypothetical protein [Yinghuangia sp. ASG 101]|nr:hypothetical protein [Yinghuangia sp. ASG 101]